MNTRFDFIMNWLWAVVWSLLGLSGIAVVGAKQGCLLNFNYAVADIIPY